MDKENGTAVREEWLTLIFCITYKIISKDYSNLYRWMQKYEDEWQHHCDNKNSTDEEKSFWRIAQLFVHFSVVEDYTAIQPLFSFHTEKNENGVWWQCALLLFYRVLLERVIRHSFVERPTGNVFRPIVQTEANSRKLTFSDIVNLNNNNNEKENSALEFYLGPHLWKRLDHNDPSDASGRCGMLLLRSQMVVLCLEGGPWPVPPRVLLSISA
ncbi:hypothetical protein AGDE_15347 [Angomonas deanei]|nr:hypothetical protein AGDE_15347 [Angomonas deanei]|eukprot:EPY19241.1 hypothetical protein AGDE_15347 [Angomonas deanei]